MRRRFPTRTSQRSIRNQRAAWAFMAGDSGDSGEGSAAPVMEQSKPRAKQKAPERQVMEAVREWARARGITLFRNNCGQYEAAPGRWVRFGLTVGSSDLIGFRTHNGVAQFVAIECKAPGKNATPEQQEFIDRVLAAGGIAGVARCVGDLEILLK